MEFSQVPNLTLDYKPKICRSIVFSNLLDRQQLFIGHYPSVLLLRHSNEINGECYRRRSKLEIDLLKCSAFLDASVFFYGY